MFLPVLLTTVLDVRAALVLGNLNIKAGIELMIITIFLDIGIRVAPIIANHITSALS